jgi:hypothetical protein
LSETTKKALTRHAVRDETEGYSHPRLVELHTAICRLPSPFAAPTAAVRTGTDDAAVGGTQVGHALRLAVRSDASACTVGHGAAERQSIENPAETQAICTPLLESAQPALMLGAIADIMRKMRPSTQVD